MSRTSQQARHDTINLERLLRRLEAAAEVGEGGSAVATGDDNLHDSVPATETSTAVKEQQQPTDYYQTLATLSNIKHARRLLANSLFSERSKSDIALRLDRLTRHYQSLHQSKPPTFPSSTHIIKPSIESLRPKVVPQAATTLEGAPDHEAASTDPKGKGPAPLEPDVADDLILMGEDNAEDASTTSRHSSFHHRRESIPVITPADSAPTERGDTLSPESGGRRPPPQPSPSTTQSLSTLLSHHRSEQDTLSEELAQMASRLKHNSVAFSDMLASDKALLETAEEKLEGNLGGMSKQRDRLKGYSKKGGVTTWFVIGAVAAVSLAWFLMFAMMRVI